MLQTNITIQLTIIIIVVVVVVVVVTIMIIIMKVIMIVQAASLSVKDVAALAAACEPLGLVITTIHIIMFIIFIVN